MSNDGADKLVSSSGMAGVPGITVVGVFHAVRSPLPQQKQSEILETFACGMDASPCPPLVPELTGSRSCPSKSESHDDGLSDSHPKGNERTSAGEEDVTSLSGFNEDSDSYSDPDFQEELEVSEDSDEDEKDKKRRKPKNYTCQECGFAASKPALLIQHLRSHSVKGYTQETDQHWHTGSHLNSEVKCACATRIVLGRVTTEEDLVMHPKSVRLRVEGCMQSFNVKANLMRHVKLHAEKPVLQRPAKSPKEKAHKCSQPGCGKMFNYPSGLRLHEENVHEAEKYAELICIYPGCGEKFLTEAELVKHAVDAHPFLLCEVCGEKISRQSYKSHARRHGTRVPVKVRCPYEGCSNIYSRESNLRQHIRSVHLMLKPFMCSYKDCGKCYAHKAARNRHELSAVHVHTGADFEREESILKHTGGRKRVTLKKGEDLYLNKRCKTKGMSNVVESPPVTGNASQS